jgi:hypothetical protein
VKIGRRVENENERGEEIQHEDGAPDKAVRVHDDGTAGGNGDHGRVDDICRDLLFRRHQRHGQAERRHARYEYPRSGPQRACMEGVRVSVVYFNEMKGYEKDSDGELLTSSGHEILSPTYVICRAVGHLSYVDSSGVIGDEFADLDKMFAPRTWAKAMPDECDLHIDVGWLVDVKPWVDRQKSVSPQMLERQVTYDFSPTQRGFWEKQNTR